MADLQAFFFDLDGTLIDSAPSILASFAAVLDAYGLRPCEPLGTHLIGPPLLPTLARITGVGDEQRLSVLADAFKAHYDTQGYRSSVVYPGVHEALNSLKAHGATLVIVTNKRIHPTRLVLQHLGWQDLFAGVYSQDAFTPALRGKAAVIARAKSVHAVDAAQAVYVGDRSEDAEAATANGLRFAWASWGYMPGLDTAPWPGALRCDAPGQWLSWVKSG